MPKIAKIFTMCLRAKLFTIPITCMTWFFFSLVYVALLLLAVLFCRFQLSTSIVDNVVEKFYSSNYSRIKMVARGSFLTQFGLRKKKNNMFIYPFAILIHIEESMDLFISFGLIKLVFCSCFSITFPHTCTVCVKELQWVRMRAPVSHS